VTVLDLVAHASVPLVVISTNGRGQQSLVAHWCRIVAAGIERGAQVVADCREVRHTGLDLEELVTRT
jgi:hypothetical protein